MFGRVELWMVWAIPSVLDELVQELNMLGPRRQTADGGWFDVFT